MKHGTCDVGAALMIARGRSLELSRNVVCGGGKEIH